MSQSTAVREGVGIETRNPTPSTQSAFESEESDTLCAGSSLVHIGFVLSSLVWVRNIVSLPLRLESQPSQRDTRTSATQKEY